MPAGGDRARLEAVALPLAAMPGGARVGTLVHGVLEHTDFAAADLDGELRRAFDHSAAWSVAGSMSSGDVVQGLGLAIDTPLGPLVGDVRLRDIPISDRLDELTFELPLAGGDAPVGVIRVAAIAELLERHVPPDDVLAGYARHLRDCSLTSGSAAISPAASTPCCGCRALTARRVRRRRLQVELAGRRGRPDHGVDLVGPTTTR